MKKYPSLWCIWKTNILTCLCGDTDWSTSFLSKIRLNNEILKQETITSNQIFIVQICSEEQNIIKKSHYEIKYKTVSYWAPKNIRKIPNPKTFFFSLQYCKVLSLKLFKFFLD